MSFISVNAKLNFQQPILQSSVSHDPPEIILICWFGAQETYLILINIENVYVINSERYLINIFIFLYFHCNGLKIKAKRLLIQQKILNKCIATTNNSKQKAH